MKNIRFLIILIFLLGTDSSPALASPVILSFDSTPSEVQLHNNQTGHSWFDQASFSRGLAETYLVGATLGIIDWAGAHSFDHPVHRQTQGIWSIAKAGRFPTELVGATLAGAIWEGGNNRIGRTLWQSLDAAAIAGISTQALKYTFQRDRPSQTNTPDLWFQGSHAQSFPSGDVSSITALVTPLILEYHNSNPWVDSLALLPVFDMTARVKAQGHWQSDVVSGAALGVLSGYFSHQLKEPFILSLLPNGFYMGLKEKF
ncbi:MAG: phosphatase PAP2 family protein [Pseudomonadota bacterium]|nr:phosphatase PAP2 family protein [Pseudomonadota bacterium]